MIKIISLILLAISSSASAIDHTMLDKFDISGYLGYRYVWSSIDIAPVDSHPEIGLLLNYNMDTNWSAFVQMSLNRDALKDNLQHGLIYGFLSYENSVFNIPFRVNVGKLRHDFRLYNADTENPATRPGGVIAPQGVYWNNLFSTLTSGYGINAEVVLGDVKLGYTIDKHVVVDERRESLMWTGVSFVKMDPFFGSHQIASLHYEPADSDFKVKAAFTKLQFSSQAEPIEFFTLGIGYDDFKWNAAAEVVLVKNPNIEWDDFHRYRYGYSLTIGYNITDSFEIHTNFNGFENSELNTVALTAIKEANEWKDFSIGFTKAFNSFEFKMDLHKVWGGRTLDSSAWSDPKIKSWYYMGTSLVYHF